MKLQEFPPRLAIWGVPVTSYSHSPGFPGDGLGMAWEWFSGLLTNSAVIPSPALQIDLGPFF